MTIVTVMGARDSGWLQMYAEDAQEAYDNFIMGVRIAEDMRVRLPVMTCQDGFITSHAVQNLSLLDDNSVKNFVGEYCPEKYLLNKAEPMSVGPYDIVDYYMEHKTLQAEAMKNSVCVINEIAEKLAILSGRHYGMIERYCMDDAEYAMVIIGSSAGTAKEAVNRLRKNGHKVGLVKIRVFRPFPKDCLVEALRNVKAVAIMDKAESFSSQGGPLGAEVKSALYGNSNASALNVVYGLGGRDFKVEAAEKVFLMMKKRLL